MFVSRGKYDEKEALAKQLEMRLQETLDRVAVLEAENTSLANEVEHLHAASSQVNDSILLKCIIDALQLLTTALTQKISQFQTLIVCSHIQRQR